MYKKLLCYIIFLCRINTLFAQSEEDNIIIANRNEVYTFVEEKGNVFIKEKTETNYECTKMGASTLIAEMYDNQSIIDKVNTKGLATPKYNLYTSNELFYTDARVCHFNLPFDRKGSTAQVKFEKTYKDPRYFTSVYLTESLFVKEKTVTVIIPDWMIVEINERNFGKNVNKEIIIDEKKKTHTYIYRITDEKGMKTEDNMPGRSHIYSHLLFLIKSSTIDGVKTTYFETLDNLYTWYHNIMKDVNNDKAIIKLKAGEISKDCKTNEDKVKALFAWVQNNIRYLAFEDGIAGFKPDDVQEVLRKKYGDCKGMSNLLTALLVAEGFDARISWLGTNHIAYDYSTPSLSADNHMICTLFFENKIYYLDPTVKYMPLGEYPQTIQGRQILVEDKDKSKYLLNRIPDFSPTLNTDSLYCEYSLSGDIMQGTTEQYYKGEAKQSILSLMDATPKDKLDTSIKQFLENNSSQNKITDIQIDGASSQSKNIKITYKIANKSGIQSLNNEYYIDLDHKKEFYIDRIDTAKRVNDIEFSYKHHIVSNIIFNIPKGYTASYIPSGLNIKKEGYLFRINYIHSGNQIIYRKEISVSDPLLKKTQFADWNTDILNLKKAYLEQITLIKQ